MICVITNDCLGSWDNFLTIFVIANDCPVQINILSYVLYHRCNTKWLPRQLRLIFTHLFNSKWLPRQSRLIFNYLSNSKWLPRQSRLMSYHMCLWTARQIKVILILILTIIGKKYLLRQLRLIINNEINNYVSYFKFGYVLSVLKDCLGSSVDVNNS